MTHGPVEVGVTTVGCLPSSLMRPQTLLISPGSRLSGSRLGWALKDCLGLTYILVLEGAVKVNQYWTGGASLAKGDAMKEQKLGKH